MLLGYQHSGSLEFDSPSHEARLHIEGRDGLGIQVEYFPRRAEGLGGRHKCPRIRASRRATARLASLVSNP